MLKAILVGASGKMGGFITDCAAADTEIEIIAGVDKVNIGQKYSIFSDFESINTKADVIIDFFASWCGPCRMVSPIVAEIAEEHPEFVVAKVNVDENPELAGEFGVMSIPTLVVIKDGKVINQSAGARPKAQILAMLEG